jgi:predicted PurR-regulated permease PerM
VVLALFVAAWSLVPVIGIAVGTLVVTVFLATFTSAAATILVAAGLLAVQAADIVGSRRWVHDAVQVGPFLSLFALMLGLEVYGIGGALVSFAIIVWVAALGVQLAPTDADVIEPADLGFEGLGTGATAP